MERIKKNVKKKFRMKFVAGNMTSLHSISIHGRWALNCYDKMLQTSITKIIAGGNGLEDNIQKRMRYGKGFNRYKNGRESWQTSNTKYIIS